MAPIDRSTVAGPCQEVTWVELRGRDDELAELLGRLRTRRLVTVTGPGGIGKSALARRAAASLAPDFERGTFEVDLTRVHHPGAVGEAIAAQLGFADFESLVNTPADQPALVLIDNCEHVLDEAATAIDELLRNCREPTVLATSRSPLDLPGESIVAIGPLATPGPDAVDLAAPALELFVERAADHGVAVDSPLDLELAAAVVERLDGVPLAVELAAARLRTLSLAEIGCDLETRPHALARPRYRGRHRHRSVAELVGWSCDLLGNEPRTVFEHLGVFAGPFTAAMVAVTIEPGVLGAAPPAVGAGRPDAIDGVRDRLEELVDASLVAVDRQGPVTWYRLLHPVRAVARERLRQRGLLPAAESRLVDHVAELAVDVINRSAAGWDASVLGDLLSLYGDITMSLRWVVEHDAEADRALLLLAVLWGVVHQAHTDEVGRLGEQVLARWPDPGSPLWADAAATVATCRNLLGDHAGAIALAERALADTGGSPFAPATLRRVLAQAHRATADRESARDWFLAGAKAADEHNAGGLAMELWVDHGILLAELGDVDAGLAIIDDARARALDAGAAINAAWALGARGLALTQRTPAEAVGDLEVALVESRAADYPAGSALCLRALAAARADLGDLVGASDALLELLDHMGRVGSLADLRMALDTSAVVLARAGRDSWVDLAATAQQLPVTNVGTPVRVDVLGGEAVAGRVLSMREAYLRCRAELHAVHGGGAGPAGTGASAADSAPARRGSRDAEPRRVSAPRSAAPSMVAEGDVWAVTYGELTVRLRASKGLADLATLLAAPGRDVSCLELMGSPAAGQGGMEVLDATARRQYEDRVRELQAGIEQAEADNDIGRAEADRVELDAIIDQLTAAIGLGGRSRRVGDDAERARSAVTRRLRDAVRRLGEEHPELGAHLRACVHTGHHCRYQPDDDVRWTVRP